MTRPRDLPPEVSAQLDEIVDALAEVLGESLLGVYAHGSLVLGCFQPERSDLDVLAVASRAVTPAERITLGEKLRRISAPKAWPRAGRWVEGEVTRTR